MSTISTNGQLSEPAARRLRDARSSPSTLGPFAHRRTRCRSVSLSGSCSRRRVCALVRAMRWCAGAVFGSRGKSGVRVRCGVIAISSPLTQRTAPVLRWDLLRYPTNFQQERCIKSLQTERHGGCSPSGRTLAARRDQSSQAQSLMHHAKNESLESIEVERRGGEGFVYREAGSLGN